MKKLLNLFPLLLVLILCACGNGATNSTSDSKTDGENQEKAKSETITYQSENGPIEVPADPKRVIVFHPFAGHVLASDINVVGADKWAKANPRFQEKLKGQK